MKLKGEAHLVIASMANGSMVPLGLFADGASAKDAAAALRTGDVLGAAALELVGRIAGDPVEAGVYEFRDGVFSGYTTVRSF